MKIKLIEPKFRGEWGEQDRRDIRAFWFPRLTLPTLAALTPPDIQVTLTDENIEEIDYDEDVDLVGITAMTMHAPGAYRIAERFREKGVTVVMGGIHASLLPQEAKEYADSVVIGEAEEVWPQVLEDFRSQALRPFYRAKRHPDLSSIPLPRRDLLKRGAYANLASVQTTRGCPFGCDYCSVSRFFGRTYRTRPIDDVIEELRSLGDRFVAFVDDNIIGNPRYAKELFRRLKDLGIRWGSQASITIADDPELLKLAAESGCYSLFIGIESLNAESLADVHKNFNRVEKYEEAIKRIKDHGIMVLGSFIFGLDHDDEGVFERTVRFCERIQIELPVYFILTPIPGTRVFERLEREGRIISKDWEKYDGLHVVFRPKRMSVETLQRGFQWACQESYSLWSIAKRILWRPRRRVIPQMGLNLAFRRMANRVPKGQLSVWGKLLSRLNVSIPIRDRVNLIPTFSDISLEKGKAWVKETYDVLKVKAVYDEHLRTLVLKLEGALDLDAARDLIRRVGMALQHGTKVIIDFEHIHYLSPKAANLLLRENLERLRRFKDQICIMNLGNKIQGVMGNLKVLLDQVISSEGELLSSK